MASNLLVVVCVPVSYTDSRKKVSLGDGSPDVLQSTTLSSFVVQVGILP